MIKKGSIRKRNDGISEYTLVGIKSVKDLLDSVLPYLVIKEPQAKLILSIIDKCNKNQTRKEFLDLCIVRAELIDTVLSIMYNMFKESNNLETTWIDIPNEVQHNILEYLTNDELHILTLT